MFRFSIILTLLFSEFVLARAANISGKWLIPNRGIPSFYRYFKEEVTWDEAREICHSQNGDLITGEMEVVTSYLKQLDVINHVWIGLVKEMSRSSFNWINGDPIAGDGYWLEPAPKSTARLCAALDPTSDFRWVVFHCWGPETSSFVCQQKVPDWGMGCLITELPSVSITLEPEIGVIELTSDCGLAGTRRIACKGRINSETVRRLSCDVDPFSHQWKTEGGNGGPTRTPNNTKTFKRLHLIANERPTRH